MNKYFVTDEEGDSYYFHSFIEIAKFLGVNKSVVIHAFDTGKLIQSYAIDELI